MKNDYIEINDKKYRVEFNWNAITDFLESEGLQLTDADDLKQLKPRQVTGLIYAGVVEGCRMDAIEFPFSKLDFGAMISPPQVGELLLIYQRHTTIKKSPSPEREGVEGEQKKRFMRFRRKSSSN
jgi:hypothetical protein